MSLTRQIESLRRAFRWHRRLFAAIFAAIAVFAALSVVLSRGDSGTELVVAARDLPGGAVLTAADLTLVRAPTALAPAGAFAEPSALIGRTIVAALPKRRVLTNSDLLGAGGQVGANLMALPVRFGEAATISLLRVGDRIDILGASQAEGGFGVVAKGVRIVAIPQEADGGLLGASSSEVVLVEVSESQAAALTAAAAVSSLGFALR